MGMINTSLSHALFTQAQQRVLALLFGHPERSFYANELIHLADSGTGATQREIAKLTTAGLLTVQRIGNQKHYQANPDNPIFSELRSLILKTCGLAEVVQQVLMPVTPQIQTAFIYGSIAKQQDNADSDIDLLIISNSLSYADVFPFLEKATVQLGRTLNPNIYTVADWKRKCAEGNAFVTRISNQKKIYLIGTENDSL